MEVIIKLLSTTTAKLVTTGKIFNSESNNVTMTTWELALFITGVTQSHDFHIRKSNFIMNINCILLTIVIISTLRKLKWNVDVFDGLLTCCVFLFISIEMSGISF